MPIYTYRCESCGVQFERNQKFSDAPLTRCPECGKKSLRKVYMPVGIVFKGSGFYSTDHRSPSGGGRAGGAHSEEKQSSEKTASESKPAAPDSGGSSSATTDRK
jgi:putative FmdB family regulatory protein